MDPEFDRERYEPDPIKWKFYIPFGDIIKWLYKKLKRRRKRE